MKRFAIMVSLQIIEMQQSWLAWVFILCLYLHLQFLGCQELPQTPPGTNGTYGYQQQNADNGTIVGNATRYSERITTDDTNRTSASIALTEIPDNHHDNNSIFNCVNSTSNHDSRNIMALKFLCVKYFSDFGGGVADRCSTVEELCLFQTEFNISDKDLEIIRHMPLKSFHLHNVSDVEQPKESPTSAQTSLASSVLSEDGNAAAMNENASVISQTSSPIPPSTTASMHLENVTHSANITEISVKHKEHDKGNFSGKTQQEFDIDNLINYNSTSSAPESDSSENDSSGVDIDDFVGYDLDTNETMPTTTLPNNKKENGYSDDLEKLNVYKIFQDWSKKHRKKVGREENEVLDETHVVPYGDHESKAELHGKTKTEESQLAGFQWQNEHYMMNVLVPIGVGISGALLIVSLFYLLRTCSKDASGRNVQRRPSRNMGRMEVQMPQETATTDHVMLLADSSDDEF